MGHLFYNPKARVIAKNLKKHPEDWHRDSDKNAYLDGDTFTLVHKSGLSIWVASGWWFMSIYTPEKEKLGLFGRTHVWWNSIFWRIKNKSNYTYVNKNDILIEKIKENV